MEKRETKLSKGNKLLIVIYKMSSGEQNTLKYEDIFVKAFKKYPGDFHLRGYPQYPDTGDSTQRPLYSLRKNGFIQIHNKFVTLTEKGLTLAQQLINTQTYIPDNSSQKLSRDMMNEIDRIKNTDAFQLFVADKKDQVVDTDFFSYLGTTVKTERTDFRSRIKTIKDVIDAVEMNNEYKIIVDLHNYLFERFKNVIIAKSSIGYPRRKKHE
ncbi:MAG: hypothetical protein HZA08_00640 [Nitrospirae bacterium]|nr:hypothetical protein [Nitrospirota bacterium]